MRYNQADTLPQYLTSLDGLNDLLVARKDAGYIRREPLEAFMLKGRWMLDHCGNMGFAQFFSKEFKLIEDVFDGETLPKIPNVLTWDEYKRFAAPYLTGRRESFAIGEVYACVPPVGSACCVCGEQFTIETAHTAHSFVKAGGTNTLWKSNREFIGRTYAELPRAFLENDGRIVRLKATTLIAHSRSGEYINSEVQGYEYVFHEGDAIAYMTCYYTHRKCRTRKS